jgi:hypothetical protein
MFSDPPKVLMAKVFNHMDSFSAPLESSFDPGSRANMVIRRAFLNGNMVHPVRYIPIISISDSITFHLLIALE